MPNFVDYIDPTPGLEGSALKTMLAELWTAYRFSLSETAYSEMGGTMTLVSQNPQTVLFTLDKAWVPDFGRGDRESAVDKDDQISMAYVRKSGQFLLLGTPKHFAQFAGLSFKSLGHDNVSEVVALIQRHFCPRWRLVSSQAMVQEASTRLNTPQISAPKITPTSDGAVLELWVITNRHAAKITLTHASNQPSPWQLRMN
jgi:hypothetical protein